MSIGVIPATKLLAHIDRAPLYPHQPALFVVKASLSVYFPPFPYRKHTGMFMKIYFRTVS